MKRLVMVVLVLVMILACASLVGAWTKGILDEPVNTYVVGKIHFFGEVYEASIEDYGQGHALIVLSLKDAPQEEKKDLYFADWQSLMSEVSRVNSAVEKAIAVGEKIKKILTVAEFLELKEAIRGQFVRVRGIAKGVNVKKGLLYYYTLFRLTDEEGNYIHVSLKGEHKRLKDKEITVEGTYKEQGEEFEASRVVR